MNLNATRHIIMGKRKHGVISRDRLDSIDAALLADGDNDSGHRGEYSQGDVDESGSDHSGDEPIYDHQPADEQPEAAMSDEARPAADISMMHRSPKYDYEKIVDYEPVPYSNLQWDDVDREDRLTPGMQQHWDTCQLCELDQSKEEKEAWPALDNLKLCGDRYFHQMAPIALAKLMRKMYDDNVKPGVEGETPMRTRMFWIHIDEHAPTIMHQAEDSLRNMTNVLRVLRDQEIFEQHTGNKRMRVSKGPAMMMLKVEKERKYYMKVVMEMRAARSM